MNYGKNASFFTQKLLEWDKNLNQRTMPWKGEKDPYKIWLSEIILQQTRVEQGWDYYNRFIKKYPTVKKLAAAPDEEVYKLWEGLGYYSRCKNLIATARVIATTYNGKFPNDYQNILQLKGVGPYTAAAIASFAFNLPHAVVDGNVIRVLSRYFSIDLPMDTTAGKKCFEQLANSLINKSSPASYNQAIMDFGATVCKPQSPLCEECPIKKYCKAKFENTVTLLPVKSKKLQIKHRWFYYVIVEANNKVLVRKRIEKDIWQNLYEFVLIESDKKLSQTDLFNQPTLKSLLKGKGYELVSVSGINKQQLTHQVIHGGFLHIKLAKPVHIQGYESVSKKKIQQLAFPKFITGYMQENPRIFHIKD